MRKKDFCFLNRCNQRTSLVTPVPPQPGQHLEKTRHVGRRLGSDSPARPYLLKASPKGTANQRLGMLRRKALCCSSVSSRDT